MDQSTIDPRATKQEAGRLMHARRQTLHAKRPHRMEAVRTVDGVRFINDSASTFIDATLETMASLEGPLVWISGEIGADGIRGEVLAFLKERLSAVISFGDDGEATEEVLRPFADRVHAVKELRTAVFLARELASHDTVVLFRPACPSGNGFAKDRKGVM